MSKNIIAQAIKGIIGISALAGGVAFAKQEIDRRCGKEVAITKKAYPQRPM